MNRIHRTAPLALASLVVVAAACARPPAPTPEAAPASKPAASPAAAPVPAATISLDASTPERALLVKYDSVRRALAGDRTDGVAEAAKSMAADAKTLAPALAKAAETLAAAKDIKAAREAFGPFSKEAIALRTKVGAKDWHIVYCPMANQSWLQADVKKVENPYYGASMLECGYEVDEQGKEIKKG